MTDQTNNLDQLVEQYELGVAAPEEQDIVATFEARSQIEAAAEDLDSAQLKRVEKADRALIAKSDDFVAGLETAGNSLADLRAKKPRSADEWWWHLDVISPISDYFQAQPPSASSQLWSWGFTALQVVVLLVALFLIGRNLGIIPTPAPSTPAPSTPVPVESPTAIVGAFDFNNVDSYISPDKVLQMKLPKAGWTALPGTTPNEYTIAYGDSTNPSALFNVTVGDAESVYTQIMGITARVTPTPAATAAAGAATSAATSAATNVATQSATQAATAGPTATTAPGRLLSPREALKAFAESFDAAAATGQEKPTISAIQDVKIGDLAAVQLSTSYAQRAIEVTYRIAEIPGKPGQIVLVLMGSRSTIWAAAKDTMFKMLDSIIVSANMIPTPTPTLTPSLTPTLHPLLMTATAVQTQIFGLTPTITPTPLATNAATNAATSPATVAATNAASPAATSAVTSAPTVAAPAAVTPAATPAATTPAATPAVTASATPAATASATPAATASATAAATASK